MKYKISIDGACRRNGEPDCVSAGAVYIQRFDDNDRWQSGYFTGTTETCSTNQRGELLALIKALSILVDTCDYTDTAIIVTDSEYIFNAMTKDWVSAWYIRGYTTASGAPVKNADLWEHIYKLHSELKPEVNYYHIKGHLIPFGKVKSRCLLRDDPTGIRFCFEFGDEYDIKIKTRMDALNAANKLSEKNNGFALCDELMKDFVTINALVDAAANVFVEKADENAQS